MNNKDPVPADYWPCMCVKRDRAGNLKSIKCHAPKVKKCRVCKAEKPINILERFTAKQV